MTAAKLSAGAVGASQLANDAVGNNQLAESAVTRNKIAAEQVVKSLNGLTDNLTLAAFDPPAPAARQQVLG